MTSKNKLDALLRDFTLFQNISAPEEIDNTEFVEHFVGKEDRNIKPSSKKTKVRNRIDKNTVKADGILENEKLVHKEVEQLRDFNLLEITCEIVEINTDHVGLFLGKKDRNIQALSKKFKVRMQVDENTVRITGMRDDVQMARKEVELMCARIEEKYSEAFEIKPEQVGLFLGKKGGNIQALSKKFKVRMQVDENTVRITGMRDDVQMARKEVELMYPQTEDKYSESFEVKSQYVGFIIGREGSRIKSLRIGHMVIIKIGPQIQGDTVVQIYGDEDNVKSARRKIEKIVSELSFKMNAEYEEVMKFCPDQIGHIIGKHGKNIEAIKQEFDVLVEIEADDEVQISGARQNVIAARKDIQMRLKLVHVETRILKNEQR